MKPSPLNRRDAEALVTQALAFEERAKRLTARDPDMAQKVRADKLHEAARLVGDVGRNLRTELKDK